MADKTLLLKGTGALTLSSGLVETGRFVRVPYKEKPASRSAPFPPGKSKAAQWPEDPEDGDPDYYEAPSGGMMSGYKVMGRDQAVSVVVKVLKSHSADFRVGTADKGVIPIECRASRKRTIAVLNEIRSAF